MEILIKLSFSCNDDRLISLITEKIGASPAQGWQLKIDFLDKSLIYTKNDRGPRIDPRARQLALVTTMKMTDYLTRLPMHFSGRLDIPRDCSLSIRPS